jgi:hypothetical protein
MLVQIIKANKKVIFLAISALLILVIIYASNAKYSISEITADNYESKLKRNDASLFEADLDNAIPENFSLWFSYKNSNSNNFRNNGVTITNEKTVNGNWVQISSSRTRLNYWIAFDEGIMTSVSIFKQAYLDTNSPPTPLIKEIIDKLILDKGFLLKRTHLKSGSDIVIKETKNCFIIGKFFSYDSPIPVSHIIIETFSKKKYF